MAGTMKMFCIRKNICSHGKKKLLLLPCNMAAVQNLYWLNISKSRKEEVIFVLIWTKIVLLLTYAFSFVLSLNNF